MLVKELPGQNTVSEQLVALPVDEFSVRQLWNVVSRNRFLILACLIVMPLLTGILSSLVVPVYESTLSLRIDEKASALPVLEELSALSNKDAELNTEMEMLRSRALAEQTVDSLALQVVVETPLKLAGKISLNRPQQIPRNEVLSMVKVSREAIPAHYRLVRAKNFKYDLYDRTTEKFIRTLSGGELVQLGGLSFMLAPQTVGRDIIQIDVNPHAQAVNTLRASLSIRRPQREANFVTVRYESPDRQLAREVPNVLAASFLAVRKLMQKTEARSTVAFLRQQIDTLSKQLVMTEDALRSFREGNQVLNLGAESSLRVSELARLQAARNAKVSEQEALARALRDARTASQRTGADSASAFRNLISFPTLINTAASQYLVALNEAENQRTLLLQRRTRQDRDVEVLSARIRELEQQLSTSVQTYLSGLTSQIASMDAELATFGSQLEKIPSKEMQFVRLERQNKVLSDIYMMLQTRLQEAQIAQAVEDSRVRVVDAAIIPLRPIKPNKKQFVILGLLVGALVGGGLAMLRDSLDRAVHTREEMTQLTTVGSLGLIPHIQNRKTRTYTASSLASAKAPVRNLILAMGNSRGPIAEAYRTLRTNILFARPDSPTKFLVLTSPTPADGKSTTAANLAATVAQQGVRVLLIDGDMRRGTLHQLFDIPKEPGLSNVLIGAATSHDSIVTVEMGELGKLDILPCGTFPPNPSELFSSTRIVRLLAELDERYDFVIMDTPPLNLVTDAAILGAKADGVILIGRAGKTDKGAIAYAAEQLRHVRAPLIGTVLNDFDFRRDVRSASYGTSGYYYYSAYGYGRDSAYAYGEEVPEKRTMVGRLISGE